MVQFARNIWSKLKSVFARYEAAYQRWGDRSWIPAQVQDARIDADYGVRFELIRRHRYHVNNNGFLTRIRNLFIQFSVGISGLECVPNSSDEIYNESRKQSWESWCENPELSSNLTMGQLEIQWAGALFDDGDVFVHLTEGFNGPRLIPKINTIASHRVRTPPDQWQREGTDIIDGIHVDKNLKPIGYFVRDGLSGKNGKQESYTEIPADEIVHLFKARRPGMLRGLPEGFSVMNDLHDLDDLQMLQMQKAKEAAAVTNIIENATGELNPASMRRARLRIGTQDADGNATTHLVPNYYQTILGARTLALRTGEKMTQFRQEEPGIVTQQYWDHLISKICCGYNVPKLLVTPYSLQGTVTRADLDVCTNAFRANFEIVAWGVRQIYQWQGRWDAQFNRQMDGKKPSDYLSVVIRPPRPPNVDIGRNAQALALELKIGTVTYQDIFAERQQDWRQQLRQAAETAAYLRKLAKEFSNDGVEITVDDIAQKIEQPTSCGEPEPDKDDVLSAQTA